MADQDTKNLCVGLLAHVDAGKTTLSEALLYTSGQLRRLGRVDHGDAFLDTDVQERERGITIFSKQAELQWKDLHILLMDTPGHVDFSGETERAMRVLDCAVLVISGADGVQGHTLTLWRLLAAYGVPVLIFINKMDQPGMDRAALMQSLKSRLSDGCVDMSAPEWMEEAALCGEDAMESYLASGRIPQVQISAMVGQRKLFPCFFGSALKLKGMETLLDALRDWMPVPVYPQDFAARVFKISRDPQGARLTWLKVTGGALTVRSQISQGDVREKVSQIRLYSGAKYRLADSVPAGTVCAVTGLTASRAGDGLGAESASDAPLLTPVFTYQVLLPAGYDPHRALEYFRILEEEDPQLHVLWNGEKREIRVQLMGEVQLEVLTRLLHDRFSLNVGFGEGSILYRETISAPAEGIGHYEPLRHYAEVHLLLEPAAPGSGMHFASDCSEDDLDRSWQRLILTHLMEKRHIGVLTGSPVTDMKITLMAGKAHLKHTEGGDFRQATYRAVRQGLMQAPGVLLEPWYDIRLEVPQDMLGRAMNDLTRMGGSFGPAEPAGEKWALIGSAPAAALRGYAREVTAYTRGRGRLTCTLRGYFPCRDQQAVVAAIGYDPERDTDNPADSVFCSHGAGYTVKWDQVPQHMHLPSVLASGRRRDGSEKETSSAPVRLTAADDKQLMAIFERTYGPVRERRIGNSPAQTRPTVNDRPIRILTPGEDYLLVDGYNIIFAWPDLKQQAAGSLEDARTSLQDILVNYRGFRPCHLILVFDAYKVHGNSGSAEEYQGIHIVYTREAETADNYIERTIRTLPKDRRVRVATSDALEQLIIMGGGALRMSANEFRQEVESARVEIEAILRRTNSARDGMSNMEKAMREAADRKQRD